MRPEVVLRKVGGAPPLPPISGARDSVDDQSQASFCAGSAHVERSASTENIFNQTKKKHAVAQNMTRVIYPLDLQDGFSLKQLIPKSVHFFACVTIHTVIMIVERDTLVCCMASRVSDVHFSPRWLSSSWSASAECMPRRRTTARMRT